MVWIIQWAIILLVAKDEFREQILWQILKLAREIDKAEIRHVVVTLMPCT